MTEVTDLPPEAIRRAIFAAVVEAQDQGASVPASRATTAARFAVSVTLVTRIEREGLDGRWPPL